MSELDVGYGKHKLTRDVAEVVVLHLTPTAARDVRQQLEQSKADIDAFKQQVLSGKADMESCVSHWSHFERSLEGVSSWLTETERRLNSEPAQLTDLPEKRAEADKFRVITLSHTCTNLYERCQTW